MEQPGLVNDRDPSILVHVSGFTKSYGDSRACSDVSLRVRKGEIFGLIGPDGSGKSTLLNAISGILAYDTGVVEVFNTPMDSEKNAQFVKHRLGYMPQGLGQNLYSDLSVDENIEFFAGLNRLTPEQLRDRREELLKLTRLIRFRRRPMKRLSGGMKQKLGLICTLMHQPELLLLDEPTTGVDPVSRRDFWSILARLLRVGGATAIVSTAYLDEASRFNRLALLFQGRIIAHGAPETIRQSIPGTLVTVDTRLQHQAFGRIASRFPLTEARGPRIRAFVKNTGEREALDEVRSLVESLPVDEIRADQPELEDVFIALLQEKELVSPSAPAPQTSRKHESDHTVEGTAIEAEGLIKDFGDFRAVNDVGFRISRGEIFGLLGANGAGKTTLIKMLVGILPPSRGSVRLGGKDLGAQGRDARLKIGYMSQIFSLYGDLSVVENIRLYAGVYGLSKSDTKERLQWVLEMADLESHRDRLTEYLPVGLRQRLALGCALVHGPEVLFLDEPTSGVDPLGRRRFWELLFRLSREEKVSVLITTHYMSEAEYCDHLVLMYEGGVAADSTPSEMKKRLEKEAGSLIEITASPPLDALEVLEKAGFRGAALHGERIHVLAHDPKAAEERIRRSLRNADFAVTDVKPCPVSMEDVFVYRVSAMEKREETNL